MRAHHWSLLGAGVLTLLLGDGCSKSSAPAAAGPVDVTVVALRRQDVPVTQEWVATLYGYVDAQIRAQVSGYLLRQDYREGTRVHRGDRLFEIDPRPFQAALDQAESQLAQAQAQFGKTEEDVKRYGPLSKDQAISAQEFDDAVQANLGAKAQIAAAQAQVATARLNLAFTRIVSPVDGIAGLVQVQVGDLVGPGSGVLTTVSTLDPMKVYFPISESTYLDLRRQFPEADGFPPDVKLSLVLSDGSQYPYPGKFYASNLQIDSNTGTMLIAATFPNPHLLLRPGQYGRVRAVVSTLPNATLVPTRALSELQGGYELATVDAGHHARLKPVTVGPQHGADTVITGGLEGDETIVVDGFQKLHDGTPVTTHPYLGGS
ncbi:MAG TPA: efflux RND transporter periplasmic adaptor subunit [Opitutaceae bacterium]|jgi:membrane fusion protein (multidrug efflux system)